MNSELCDQASIRCYIPSASNLLLRLKKFKVYGCFTLLCFIGVAVQARMKNYDTTKEEIKDISFC